MNFTDKRIEQLEQRVARLENKVFCGGDPTLSISQPKPSSVSECRHEWTSGDSGKMAEFCIKCGEPKPTTTPEVKHECKFFTADEEGHPYCNECGAYAYYKKPFVEKCEEHTLVRRVQDFLYTERIEVDDLTARRIIRFVKLVLSNINGKGE